jgi:hypothetical protein
MAKVGIKTPSGGSGGPVDAANVTYTPAVPGDWSPVPTHVDEALDELAAAGGSGSANFSYIDVGPSATITVPVDQEMIITQDPVVEGNLVVQGIMTQLPDFSDQSFFWQNIPADKSINMPLNRMMVYRSPFSVFGNLMVKGLLIEV